MPHSKVKKTIQKYNLHTVCEEASCPNVSECWDSGTATIMIMGDVCSRGCKFCNVDYGKPFELDSEEPQHVAQAIKDWNLRYVVITSVCRDDLLDEGSKHFAKTIQYYANRNTRLSNRVSSNVNKRSVQLTTFPFLASLIIFDILENLFLFI